MVENHVDRETVLVTGGSGAIARWCIVELLRQGYPVRTTVRDVAREPEVRASIATQIDPQDRLTFTVADLTRDEGWPAAAQGAQFVLHIASPLPTENPKHEDELIVPARDGTLRVLKAAVAAGARRVVLTSSVASIGYTTAPPDGVYTEREWSDPTSPGTPPYPRSKTIAERAAWDYIRTEGGSTTLAVVNPGAKAFAWFSDIARVLRERLGSDARKVPKLQAPDVLIRFLAIFDPSARTITADLGERTEYSNAKAVTQLGWSPRPLDESIVDCARSLLANR